MPHACGIAPIDGCQIARRAVVTINERRVGNERIVFAARRFGTGLPDDALGNPVGGATIYRLCIYDEAERLVGRLAVDRAGDVCGAKERPCWRTLEVGGVAYRDETASADGVTRLAVRAGPTGKGGARVGARNSARKGHSALPTDIAAALEANDRATVQLITSDAGCISAVLNRVQQAERSVFKAKRP